MASYSDITTLVTSGGTITFNSATGNTYWINPGDSSGLDAIKLRKPFDNKGQTDGFLIHDGFEEGAHYVIAGLIVADSVANRNTMKDNLKTALRSIKATPGTLNFGSTSSISVEWELGVDFPHIQGLTIGFRFGLIATSAA